MRALFSAIERAIGMAQGKGYGSSSIRREVSAAASLMMEQPRLVIDVGGNKGSYAQAIRAAFPAAEIHVFEPALANVSILSGRFSSDSGVILQPLALGKESGHATLHADAAGSGMASLSERRVRHFGLRFEHHEPVDVIRFDEYWRGPLQSRPIDLAKLDVEGHELDVLLGFGDAIRCTELVQFEFGGCNIDTRTYFQDFWYFFQAHGFDVYRVAPFTLQRIDRYRELDEFFLTTNFLAHKHS